MTMHLAISSGIGEVSTRFGDLVAAQLPELRPGRRFPAFAGREMPAISPA